MMLIGRATCVRSSSDTPVAVEIHWGAQFNEWFADGINAFKAKRLHRTAEYGL